MSVPPDPANRPPPGWLIALVMGGVSVAFLPLLNGGFLADDFVYIARFRDLPWSEWPKLFVREWSGGVWGQPMRELRPIAALSFMGDARIFGGNPVGYRLVNLALHLVATFLVLRLAWFYATPRFDPGRASSDPDALPAAHAANGPDPAGDRPRIAAALFAGLIFGLHPAHVEAVGWITGRVDLLATTGALLYWAAGEFYCARGARAQLVVSAAALFVGIFSKELCMFAPLLLLLRWALTDLRAPAPRWKRRFALLGVSVLIVLLYAVCRRIALPPDHIGYNLWKDEPAWHRQMSYASWFVPVLPFTGLAEWKHFPSLALLHAVWIGLALAVVVSLGVALRRRARAAALALFFGGVWYFLTVAPLTAVVYHSPRHLYFPSVGLALALGIACGTRRLARVLGVALVCWCIAGHVAALQPWRTASTASRLALSSLDRALASAGPGALVVSAVPPTLGPAWLWAWSSPQNYQAPFLAHPPANVIEHPINFSRSDPWYETRRPLETVRAAPALVALYVDDTGQVFCRPVPAAGLTAAGDSLARIFARNVSPESWTEWVKSIAAP